MNTELPTQLEHVFEPQLVQEIKENAKRFNFQEGEEIMRPGENIRTMPLIISGSIKVSRVEDDGKELLLYYVSPLESCAMTFTCCMQHKKSNIRATAEDETELLAVPIEFMDKWMNKYPTWKSFVMNTISARFEELLKAIDAIAFQKLDDRLVSYLKSKAEIGQSPLLNLSHEQIAQDLATSRVVISRLLKKLENDKKLLLYRNQIKLLQAM